MRGSFRSIRQQSRRQSTVSIQADNASAFPGSTPQSPSTLAAAATALQQQQQRRDFDEEYLLENSQEQIPEVHVSARDIAQFKASIPLLRRYLLQRAKDHPKGQRQPHSTQHHHLLNPSSSSSPKRANTTTIAGSPTTTAKKATSNKLNDNSSGVPPSTQMLSAYVHSKETDVLQELHPPEGEEIALIVTHSRPADYQYPLSSDDDDAGQTYNQHNLSINTTSTAVAPTSSSSPPRAVVTSSPSRHAVPALNTIVDGQHLHNRSVLTAGSDGGDKGDGGVVVESGPPLWAEDTLLWLLDDTNPTAVSIVKLALAEQEELRQTSLVMESFLGTEGVCAVAAAHSNYWEEVHQEYRRHISGSTPQKSTSTTTGSLIPNASKD